jgi:hypothetical protein
MDDLLAWHYGKKGVFSVKSAYHTLDDVKRREARRQYGGSSSSAGSSGSAHGQGAGFEWKKIWRLNCPPKVRHFLWRFSHNSLPLRRNISRRGMDIDTRCPVCWRLDEDGGHCFFKCKFAKECWRALNLEDARQVLSGLSSAKQVTEHVLSMPEEKKLLIVGLLWAWWDAHNKANVGEQRRSTDEIIYRARSVVHQEEEAVTEGVQANARGHAQRWISPPPDVWKINVDAAFWAEELAGAWGFVVRDNATAVLGRCRAIGSGARRAVS